MVFNIETKNGLNKPRKSILFLLDDVPSCENPHSWGHAFEQIRELSKTCDVTVVSPVYFNLSLRRFTENIKTAKKMPPYMSKMDSITCWRPRYVSFSFIPWQFSKHYFQICSMIGSLLLLIVRKKIRFDIIHAHFIYRPGYLATILGRLFRKPVVITAHGSDVHQNLLLNQENPIFRKRTLATIKKSNWIIAVSENIKNLIEKEGVLNKTSVIPCGFSKSEFYPMDTNMCREKLSLNPDKKYILYIGNLEYIKGVDILIKAFNELCILDPRLELLIIGDGAERKALEKQVHEYSIDKRIRFLGRRKHTEIPLFINASDVVAIPSRNEGRPVIVFESLACGTAVVASRVGGIPETIVNDTLGILVDAENTVALANGIKKALLKRFEDGFLSDYVSKYEHSELISEINDVYQKLLFRS